MAAVWPWHHSYLCAWLGSQFWAVTTMGQRLAFTSPCPSCLCVGTGYRVALSRSSLSVCGLKRCHLSPGISLDQCKPVRGQGIYSSFFSSHQLVAKFSLFISKEEPFAQFLTNWKVLSTMAIWQGFGGVNSLPPAKRGPLPPAPSTNHCLSERRVPSIQLTLSVSPVLSCAVLCCEGLWVETETPGPLVPLPACCDSPLPSFILHQGCKIPWTAKLIHAFVCSVWG